MRRILLSVVALLAGVLIPLSFGVPAQAAQSLTPTVWTATIHGHRLTIVALPGKDAEAVLARISAANSQVSRPNVANPCFGLQVLCLFPDINGGGAGQAFTEGALFLPGFINLTDIGFNDQMSSWGNDIPGDPGAATMCWWVDTDGGGAGHLMRPLGNAIQNVSPSENDQASSIDTKNPTCH